MLALIGLALAGLRVLAFSFSEFAGLGTNDEFATMLNSITTLPVVLLAEALAAIMFRCHWRSLEQKRYYISEVMTLSRRFRSESIIAAIGTNEDLVALAIDMGSRERSLIPNNGEATLETMRNAGDEAMFQNLLDILSPNPRNSMQDIK